MYDVSVGRTAKTSFSKMIFFKPKGCFSLKLSNSHWGEYRGRTKPRRLEIWAYPHLFPADFKSLPSPVPDSLFNRSVILKVAGKESPVYIACACAYSANQNRIHTDSHHIYVEVAWSHSLLCWMNGFDWPNTHMRMQYTLDSLFPRPSERSGWKGSLGLD